MVPEGDSLTAEQLKQAAVDACTPKPGECWHYAEYGEITVECVHKGCVQTRTCFKPVMTAHILLGNWHWMLSHGRLVRR